MCYQIAKKIFFYLTITMHEVNHALQFENSDPHDANEYVAVIFLNR